ncbi:MAG: helix-turn-helix domain-containing protein [Candidatus Stygibacter australis]|nr:helix-turn-helix domain-containing protein [Candidatus Stygibacter australis]
MEKKVIKTEKSIGQYLKSVREEKELLLSKIAKKTCISEKYLMNVEADNFDDMGGLGYAKAITISYAKALGANDKLVLHLFNSKYVKPVPRRLYKREQQPKKFMIPTSVFSILILIILIVVLTLIITKLYKNGDIKFPFRNKVKSSQVEKASIITPTQKKSVSIYDTLKEETPEEQVDNADLSSVKSVQLDLSALRDSTDYTDKYLFEGEESPFNIKE